MNQQAERVALVTGGSRGIGRAIAIRLAADGFAVSINYAHDAEAAQAVVTTIFAAGGRALAVQGDVGVEADVEHMFAATQEAFGRVDVVVNSAGIMPMGRIERESLTDFDRTIATNLRGTFLVFAKAAEVLGEGGRIIALSTSVIAKSFPGYGPYIASKAGVEGLVPVLANELRGRGITVNAVAPGPVATELFFSGKSEEQIAQVARMAPLERLGQPEDIASMVAFLAGPEGAWVNAQVLRANGGFA